MENPSEARNWSWLRRANPATKATAIATTKHSRRKMRLFRLCSRSAIAARCLVSPCFAMGIYLVRAFYTLR